MRMLTALLLSAVLIAPAGRSAGDLAIVGATIYPGPGERPVANAAVLIRDGRIAAIGPRAGVQIPAGVQVIDGTGTFVTAGFWNSHVHVFTPGLLHAADAPAPALQRELDGMLNRWGFTTVFDVASVLANTQALSKRIAAGELNGPRVYTVGEPLWTKPPVYVLDFLQAQHIDMPEVRSPDEAAARVRDLAAHGVQGVKLFTGSVQRGSIANMPLDVARAAASEAHRHSLTVFAHPQNSEGLEVAIEAGVDVLTHPAPDSPDWTASFVARLVRHRIALTPTLTLFDFEARNGGLSDADRERWIAKAVGQLRAFRDDGGDVLFGTDVGYTTHVDTTLEFELLQRAGLDATAILASLTTTPARRFGASAHAGLVKPGYDGDLVVLAADPGRDVRNFARVRYTVRAGAVLFETR